MKYYIYQFAGDLMSSEVLINSKNVLSKAKKEEELQRFLGTINPIIHKIKLQLYTNLVVSVELNTSQWYMY